MFSKIVVVVFAMVVAACVAAPGYLHGYSDYALPVATSYSNRYDVYAHSVPVVTKIVEPAYGYSAPLYGGGYSSYGSYGHGW